MQNIKSHALELDRVTWVRITKPMPQDRPPLKACRDLVDRIETGVEVILTECCLGGALVADSF